MSSTSATPPTPTSYLQQLLVFLCLVAFFDGYDLFAISQTLPELRLGFGLSPESGSRLLAIANIGTIAAYFLMRLADRWGRRPLLIMCVAGYSLASLLSAAAPEYLTFFSGQFTVRLFLVSALAVVVMYATEEYPSSRRGRIVGLIQACFSIGGVVCAVITPKLLKTGLGWRSVYLAGGLSALLLIFAVLRLRETERFLTSRSASMLAPLIPKLLPKQHRKRMLQLAAVWLVTFTCNQSALIFWKEFAQAERSMSNEAVGTSIAIASVLAIPLVVWFGRFTDRIGRRRSAAAVYAITAIGVLGSYSSLPKQLLVVPLLFLIFGTSAAVAVLNTWTAECFPTEMRGDSFAWANSLLGRIGFVLSPLLVSELVSSLGWSHALSLTAILPLLAIAMTNRWLPETAGKDLEDLEQSTR